jgi:hypothetical protein
MATNPQETEKPQFNTEQLAAPGAPLIFISHDSRDAELAEAFSKLLRSVSAGMLKSFRSSDKKGSEGIEFGDEWYKRLMTKLQTASDVVCLFTERSLDRPWILYEAGVAKGKLDTPVHGIALGVQLSRVTTGPFYQFQNLDDTEESLTKLVLQLARRVPALEPDGDVVRTQVKVFKAAADKILEKLSTTKPKQDATEADPVAKLFEEVKVMFRDLPGRVAERMGDVGDPIRRKRMRRFHPMMFEEISHMGGEPGDPIGILMGASLVRDELPWLYELCLDAYRAVKAGDLESIEREASRLRRIGEFAMHGPFGEMFEPRSKEEHMMMMEFPRVVEHTLRRCLEEKKASIRPRQLKKNE